jgi:starvation-inducible DNA-binding protein
MGGYQMSNHSFEAKDMATDTGSYGLGHNAVNDIAKELNALLADAFALYFKTKNFHWHVSGPNFRSYHLLLDDQATQIFAMTDSLAERARKIGATTLRSVNQVAEMTRIAPSHDEKLAAPAMLAELMSDNREFIRFLRHGHAQCDNHGDVASASLIENWIDEAEQRHWFLSVSVEGHR